MNDVPSELLDFIRTGSKFLIAGHKEEDGDCVGSQLALCSVLKRLGKEAIPCSAGPFKRTEVKPYEKYFCTTMDEKLREGARLIITDCNEIERTGDLAPFLKGLPAAFIDHHKAGQDELLKNSGPFYICESAPSVTLLILHLMDALGLQLSVEEAEYLLFGLCTDTGFFRHGDTASCETFEAAARLVCAGASPRRTYQTIYGGKSLGSRHFLGSILSRTESFFAGKLLVTTEEYDEIQLYGAEGRDSDALYQLLQAVDGVEAIAVIRQEKPDTCTVGFRSREDADVAAVAAYLGGGGHKNAAGASVSGTIPQLKTKILELFADIFQDKQSDIPGK